jgi:hypothetical protein
VNEEWHTWIDYDKFHALVEKYNKEGEAAAFTAFVSFIKLSMLTRL